MKGSSIRRSSRAALAVAPGSVLALTATACGDDGSGSAGDGSSVVSAGNNWDSGISTLSFVSTDATTVYNARKPDGSRPATTFLTTGSTAIGATMN